MPEPLPVPKQSIPSRGVCSPPPPTPRRRDTRTDSSATVRVEQISENDRMDLPASIASFLELVQKSGLLEAKQVHGYVESKQAASGLPEEPRKLAGDLIQTGLLTRYQAAQLLAGKWRGFILNGKYKILEHLGSGGMGNVYLCEHLSMRRRVAIKILPVEKAKDASYLDRFYREARAVAALDHPNIVRAHDVDDDRRFHFLVMEYVDGSSLQEIVSRHGPLDPVRAAHYMAQAAAGLQHAHEVAGLVHRDIKPGNILVDRSGTVKILDLGLARFFRDDDGLSKKYDETVLGTTDYLAPEQTIDSAVDIRADIYSLGATFYFCLTGQTLFGEGLAAQKLIWHQTRQPKSICSLRPEVPEELAEIIEKRMLAKKAANRFQQPHELIEALLPWTQTPVPPPSEQEMPRLCLAARGSSSDVHQPVAGDARQGSSPSARSQWSISGPSRPTPATTPIRTRPATRPDPQLLGVPAVTREAHNGDAETAPVPHPSRKKKTSPATARRKGLSALQVLL